jgi:hypothetical protein
MEHCTLGLLRQKQRATGTPMSHRVELSRDRQGGGIRRGVAIWNGRPGVVPERLIPDPRDRTLYLLFFASLACALVSVRLAIANLPVHSVNVGDEDDQAYVRDFQEREWNEWSSYRWSKADSYIVLPRAGYAVQKVTLVINGWRPDDQAPPHVLVYANGQQLGSFTATKQLAEYDLCCYTPPVFGVPLDLLLRIHTDTFSPPSDQQGRTLGVLVDSVTAIPLLGPVWRWLFLAVILATGVSAANLALRAFGLIPIAALGGALTVLAAICLTIIVNPPNGMAAAWLLLALCILLYAGLALSRPVSEFIARLYLRAATVGCSLLDRVPRTVVAQWRRRSLGVIVVLSVLVGALRLSYCTQLPVNTDDILRTMYYGVLVGEKGLQAATVPLAETGARYQEGIAWSYVPFNYPIIALLFFRSVAAVSPTLFSAKLALTVLEASAALLLYAYSRDRWLAFLYWASPISIWWTSHEGQLEGLQNFFVLVALYLLSKKKPAALFFLAIAVQTKVSAILLLPVFLHAIHTKVRARSYLLYLVLGFAPTMISLLFSFRVTNIRADIVYNPYYWNFLNRARFGWNPTWLIILDQVGTYLLLGTLMFAAVRTRKLVEFFAPIAWLGVAKLSPAFQFWYMNVFESFLAPLHNKRLRLLLFVLTPLLDVRSTAQILFGPFGYTVGQRFGNLTAFTVLDMGF